ncbi:MAG TPA: type I phosphomannose isomerase catalytic subunit [Pyrinomonadaceae bacterium]|nr:type I phosphomannose isomerase catalytic subunit [Pyrinomonadaceae bacterium]
MKTLTQKLFLLEPQYRERVWGGQRLKAADPPVGEAWVAFEESRVQSGAHAGRTVAELSEEYGEHLLGREVFEAYGSRFPLLVKLLDCADWLSVQVHPNDEQAARLVGPGEFGKSEAWHFIEAEPGATIYAGIKEGTSKEALEEAIRAGRVLEVAERLEVKAGETVYIPAGTLHSLGPGLLLYEVQQSSDTTYRVYDWDRPASAGRKLHVEESVEVIDPRKVVAVQPAPELKGTAAAAALVCPYFELEVIGLGEEALDEDTRGETFHLLTLTEGGAELSLEGEAVTLGKYETALVAGGARRYRVRAGEGGARLLRCAVPARCLGRA